MSNSSKKQIDISKRKKTALEQRKDVDMRRSVSGLLIEKFAGESADYLQSQATQQAEHSARCTPCLMDQIIRQVISLSQTNIVNELPCLGENWQEIYKFY